MYAQFDPYRKQYLLLDDIIDFRKTNSALSIEYQHIVVKGRVYLRCLTVGWQVLCHWKDGSSSWEKINDLKESQSVETAEYDHRQGIYHECAFNWWAPHV